MSLPKNRKKLNENLTTDKEKPDKFLATSQDIRSNEESDKTPADSARNKQMNKAFEIVEHIEQVQGFTGNHEQKPTSTSLISPANNQGHLNTNRLQVKVSFSPPADKAIEAQDGTGEENMPVIEVKFKIPSFFRKVPILKGITDTIIRRFAKE